MTIFALTLLGFALRCVGAAQLAPSGLARFLANNPRYSFHESTAFRRPGGYCEVAAPDPIPNSEVKRLSADGTLS